MKYKPKDFAKPKPTSNRMVVVNFRLPVESGRKLEESAHRLQTNLSSLIRRCLKDAGVI